MVVVQMMIVLVDNQEFSNVIKVLGKCIDLLFLIVDCMVNIVMFGSEVVFVVGSGNDISKLMYKKYCYYKKLKLNLIVLGGVNSVGDMLYLGVQVGGNEVVMIIGNFYFGSLK